MLTRLLPIGIVLFWLGSTAWLVRDVWFPAESRFPAVDPAEAARIFFAWNDSSNLVLLESGRRIGTMAINGYSGPDQETGQYGEGISVVGSIDSIEAGNRALFSRASWNGNLEFGPEGRVTEAHFSARLPSLEWNLHVQIDGEPLRMRVRLRVGKVTLFETEGPLTMGSGVAGEGSAPPALPEDLPFGLARVADEIGQRLGQWTPEISARRGKTKVAGRTVPVYLLKLTFPGRQELKAWLTEIGEPMRIESSWGLEALAEALVPIEALDQAEADALP